jgi:lysozyme
VITTRPSSSSPGCRRTPRQRRSPSTPPRKAGQTVDADAYVGTADELQQLLTTGDVMTPEQAQQLQQIWVQLLGPTGQGWPQLGNRTLVDALSIVLTQLVGADATGFAGWPQTGGRTDTDLIAAIAAALKVPNTYDTKAQSTS